MSERIGAAEHPHRDVLGRYAREDAGLAPADAWAVEAHVPGCAACRAALRTAADPAADRKMWTAVTAAMDAPRPGLVERTLVAVGIREHTARLLAATPSLRLSWLGAVTLALLAAAGITMLWDGLGAPLPLLLVAPLLPLLGVAVAYGPTVDPTYEVGLTTPLRGGRLFLVRAVTVLVMTVLVALPVSVALPGFGVQTVAWLLPALALTAVTMLLSTFTTPLRAAATAATAWIILSSVTIRPRTGTSALFETPWQLAFLMTAVAATAGLILLRRHLDDGGAGRQGAA